MQESDIAPRLPNYWKRPVSGKVIQCSLFTQSTEEVLADLQVSKDDVRLWREKEWISFDVDSHAKLDEPLIWEIEFVRNIARSGLSDAQINHLLRNLPKPYRSNPSRMAYHLVYGWVLPEKEDPFDVIDENLDDWLINQADAENYSRLTKVAERIAELLEVNTEDENAEESDEQ